MVLTLRLKCALLATVCLLVLGARNAAADSMTLQWDPSSGDVGYKVHVGTQSGSYSQHFDVGPGTSFTYTTATAGQRYCFAVSAYLNSSQLDGPNSSEVCGYSNTPPTLTNPGNRTSAVAQSTSLQLQGSDPDGQPLTYSATGLPPGLNVMSSTGYISGAGTTAGTYSVTARASDGVLTASQVFTWVITAPAGDTTLPTATISTPTTNTTYSTTASSVTLGGSASDNVGVTQMRWSSDRGGSGVATGTTNWSASIPLLSGANNITITAQDAAGNTGTDSINVNYSATTPDTTRPTVTISSPTTGTTYSTSSSSISIGGSASDNIGVTQVRWSTDRGASGVASGTTGWNASIPLSSGTNVVTMTALDAAGNSGTDALTVTYTVTTPPPTPSSVTLTVQTRKTGHWKSAILRWSSAPWSSVNVFRNGMLLTSFTENDGIYTDAVYGRGTFTYQVCAPGPYNPDECSNIVSVTF